MIYDNSMRKKNYRARNGQSLIEILIALAIGALLIGAAAIGIMFMIRATGTNQNLQTASGLVREVVEKLRAWSGADWQNVYSLNKGLTTSYFLTATGTTFLAIEGEEGVVESEVRHGLLARWGFDEATGTVAYDMSGGSVNGTLSGSPVRATSSLCKLGGCLLFDGTNSVSAPDTTSTDPTSAWTLSAWIMRNATGTQHSILEKFDNSGGLGNFAMRVTTGDKLTALVWDGTSFEDCGTTATTLLPNTWYHVVATFSASANRLSCFVNGAAESTNASVTIDPPASSVTLKIGCRGNDCGTKFDGRIDDARIYDRALTADEISRIARSRMFTRSFSIENTCRSANASSSIETTPCSGGYFSDPSTQKITAGVQWTNAQGGLGEVKLVEFLTRWKNQVFYQRDWSGGSGQEGPISVPNDRFASSTNINIDSQGVIKIQGL